MLFSSLAEYVRGKFKGLLVIGDLHADHYALQRAIGYAEEHNLFLLSLGDLVDRGEHPYEVISLMYERMLQGKAGLTVGNHDDRFRRYYEHLHGDGSLGTFRDDARKTIDDVGPIRFQEFIKMYYELQTTDVFSSHVHTFDNLVFVHAASHPTIWDSWRKYDSAAKARFLYGETTGRTDEDGFPERLYNWIEEIPSDRTVIVGHDRKPIFNKAIVDPLVRVNAKGGTAVFIDTGCGKGGFLSGAVVLYDNTFTIHEYVNFRKT